MRIILNLVINSIFSALFKLDSDFKQLLEDSQNNRLQNSNTGELCPFCEQPSRNRCTGCYVTRYCSKECQLAHWKKHKKTCKQIQSQFRQVELVDQSNALEELKAKENFILKIQLPLTVSSDTKEKTDEKNLDLTPQFELLSFYDCSDNFLGGLRESDECYEPLVESIKNQSSQTGGEVAFIQACVDKEKKLRVNIKETIVMNET